MLVQQLDHLLYKSFPNVRLIIIFKGLPFDFERTW
jgi:hypothetical protein